MVNHHNHSFFQQNSRINVISDNICGGPGICEYCNNYVANVAYHRTVCHKNPELLDFENPTKYRGKTEPLNLLNLLNRTRCYLVGQMQYVNGQPWRTYVEAQLKEIGIIVLNPYNHPFVNSTQEDNNATNKLKELIANGDFDAVAEIVKKIRAEDLRCVDICDFIFCHINPKFPTCGAYEEFFWANRAKKPIFLSIEGSKTETPLWLFGTIPHKYIYNNINDAVNMIKNIDNGNIPIDSDRWRLLRTEFR